MIKVKQLDNQKLVLHCPDKVHKFQTILFLVIGALPTLGILSDPESSNWGIIVPVLLMITGVLFIFVGGKGDFLIVDKLTGKVEISMSEGMFKKTVPKIYDFDEIGSSEFYHTLMSGKMVYGIKLQLKDGSEVQGLTYINKKKKAEEIFETFHSFFGR